MSDAELLYLSPAEVVVHVRRLQARIAELDAELARRGGPPKTPQKSSTPPSTGWKPFCAQILIALCRRRSERCRPAG
jgi:hypothetical protein